MQFQQSADQLPPLQSQLPGLAQPMQPQQNHLPTQSSQSTIGAVYSIGVQDSEKHTKFSSSVGGVDKAFRILCIIIKPDGSVVVLEKKLTQAD
jgi:hypothetical protein